MELQFVPRKQVVEHLENGWGLLPDHRYIPHDYAILMERVERPEPLTTEQIQAMWERIDPPPPAPETRRCKRGHYLAGHNLYARRDGRGWCCRECLRIGQRARRAAEKAMNVPARPHLIKSPSFAASRKASLASLADEHEQVARPVGGLGAFSPGL